MHYYKLLERSKSQDSGNFEVENTDDNIPAEFLCNAIFAGDGFHDVEAAYGRVEGVVRTATGYCGGTIRKPSYREVSEGTTGHTEAVKITYDKRFVSYTSLCDFFWKTHDPTNKYFLNFGLSTHLRSAVFCSTEEERKQAQQSKIRRQMKLNRRILTQITLSSNEINCEFFLAENQHQKYYLQKHYRLCESLSLRSTEQFVESYIACKLNGVLALDGELIVDKLPQLASYFNCLLPKQCRSTCDEIIQDLKRSHTSTIS